LSVGAGGADEGVDDYDNGSPSGIGSIGLTCG
jgi:hypothetical protein